MTAPESAVPQGDGERERVAQRIDDILDADLPFTLLQAATLVDATELLRAATPSNDGLAKALYQAWREGLLDHGAESHEAPTWSETNQQQSDYWRERAAELLRAPTAPPGDGGDDDADRIWQHIGYLMHVRGAGPESNLIKALSAGAAALRSRAPQGEGSGAGPAKETAKTPAPGGAIDSGHGSQAVRPVPPAPQGEHQHTFSGEQGWVRALVCEECRAVIAVDDPPAIMPPPQGDVGEARAYLNDKECDEASRMHRWLAEVNDPYAVAKTVEHFLRTRLAPLPSGEPPGLSGYDVVIVDLADGVDAQEWADWIVTRFKDDEVRIRHVIPLIGAVSLWIDTSIRYEIACELLRSVSVAGLETPQPTSMCGASGEPEREPSDG